MSKWLLVVHERLFKTLLFFCIYSKKDIRMFIVARSQFLITKELRRIAASREVYHEHIVFERAFFE